MVICALSFVIVMLNVIYCFMQTPGVPATVGIYADDETTMSSFCPTITDVRSVTWEPEGDTIVSLSSSVGERQPGTSGIKSAYNQLEKLMAAGDDDFRSHPSNSSECVTSDFSSSLISRSLVSFRRLTSFADPTAFGSAVAGPDIPSAVVMLDCSSPEDSCSSVEDLALLPDCEQLYGSGNCADKLTADCRVTRAEDVGGCKLISLDRFSKTAAAASDVVSITPITAFDETLVPCTNNGDSRCNYSEAVNIDGSVKGKLAQSTERQKSDTESCRDAVTYQSENEMSSSAVMLNNKSKKRKFKTTVSLVYLIFYCNKVQTLE